MSTADTKTARDTILHALWFTISLKLFSQLWQLTIPAAKAATIDHFCGRLFGWLVNQSTIAMGAMLLLQMFDGFCFIIVLKHVKILLFNIRWCSELNVAHLQMRHVFGLISVWHKLLTILSKSLLEFRNTNALSLQVTKKQSDSCKCYSKGNMHLDGIDVDSTSWLLTADYWQQTLHVSLEHWWKKCTVE